MKNQSEPQPEVSLLESQHDPDDPDIHMPVPPTPPTPRRIHRFFQLTSPQELNLIPVSDKDRHIRDTLYARFQEFDSARFRTLEDASAYLTLLEEIFPGVTSDVSEIRRELLDVFPPIVQTVNPLLDRPRIDRDKELLKAFGLKIQHRLSSELFAELGQEFGSYHTELDVSTSASVFWNRILSEYSTRLGSKKTETISRWQAAFMREAVENNPHALLSHCADATASGVRDPAFYGRLILKPFQSDSEFYVWDERRNQYAGPMARGSVRRFFQDASPHLSMIHPVTHLPQTTKENTILYQSGGMRSFESLCDITMTSINSIVFRAGESDTKFDDKTAELTVGVAQFRDVEPEYNAEIDNWLHRMGQEMVGKLLDWLATFRRLRHPTCAIYLQGKKASGKSMLAEGLSYLFRSGVCVPYSQLMSEFNESLKLSFLVHAEEGLSNKDHKKMPSSIFRQLITTDRQEVNSKGRTKMHFRGCLRLVISANNDGGLSLARELLEESDLEAISERILLISPADNMADATDYLRKLGGRSVTDAWVDGGGIARHVVWLEQNRQVIPGSRLLVSGEGSGSARLVVGNDRHRILDMILDLVTRNPRPEWIRVVRGNIRLVGKPFLMALNTDTDTKTVPLTLRNLGTILSSFDGVSRQKLIIKGDSINAMELPGKVLQEHLQLNPQVGLSDARLQRLRDALATGGDL